MLTVLIDPVVCFLSLHVVGCIRFCLIFVCSMLSIKACLHSWWECFDVFHTVMLSQLICAFSVETLCDITSHWRWQVLHGRPSKSLTTFSFTAHNAFCHLDIFCLKNKLHRAGICCEISSEFDYRYLTIVVFRETRFPVLHVRWNPTTRLVDRPR